MPHIHPSRAALHSAHDDLESLLADPDVRDVMPDTAIVRLARARTKIAVELYGHPACYHCGTPSGPHGNHVDLYQFDTVRETYIWTCDGCQPDGEPAPVHIRDQLLATAETLY